MSVSRWDPLREMVSLREAMDRLLERKLGAGAGEHAEAEPLLLPSICMKHRTMLWSRRRFRV